MLHLVTTAMGLSVRVQKGNAFLGGLHKNETTHVLHTIEFPRGVIAPLLLQISIGSLLLTFPIKLGIYTNILV